MSNPQDTINIIRDVLKEVHEYERSCKFKQLLFVHEHSAVLPVAFIEEALVFVQQVKPSLAGLERKWFFTNVNIKAEIRKHHNVFVNLKTQYDIFQACLTNKSVPLFFRQAEVTAIVEQIMKERERADKRIQKERNKPVSQVQLLDGLDEALKVGHDRRRNEEHAYVRQRLEKRSPKRSSGTETSGSPRSDRKQHHPLPGKGENPAG